jgi:hypothetical protein
MLHRNANRFIIPALLATLLLAGCETTDSRTSQSTAGSASASPSTASSSEPAASDTQPMAATVPANAAPTKATWVVDINDTQQITDDNGIIWNYTLTFHASKPGGRDVTGEFAGDALLKIEPDFASAQAAAAKEGTQLLALIFNYRAECEGLTFTVEKFSQDDYAAQMQEYTKTVPYQPLDPGVSTDFFAVTNAVFNSTQEPVAGTIQTDKGPFSAAGGGGGTTVSVLTDISVDGASAYVFLYNTPHPLARAFTGTITGDVLPG